MKKKTNLLIPIAILAALGGAAYWYHLQPPGQEGQPTEAPKTTEEMKKDHYEVGSDAHKAGGPLPKLEESDNDLTHALNGIVTKERMEQILHMNNFIQRFVVTIDTATTSKFTIEFLPVALAPGKFSAVGKDDDATFSDKNAERYRSYVNFAKDVDAKQAVAIYARFYPLFQQAYDELGSKGYFNDRLVAVIDHLLETPEPKGRIQLTKSMMSYKYADPALENLSAGQKTLIRIGPENEKVLKEKLRQFREQLVHLKNAK